MKKSPGSEVMIWEQNPPPMLRLFVFTVAHNVQRYIDLNSRFHQTPVFSETHQKFVWQKARNWSGQETTQVSIGPRSRETSNFNFSFGSIKGLKGGSHIVIQLSLTFPALFMSLNFYTKVVEVLD